MSDDKLGKELAEMRVRLDQLTRGRRSEFEAELLKGLRLHMPKNDPRFNFAHENNPALTAQDAQWVVAFLNLQKQRAAQSEVMLQRYNDMRAVLETALQRLPTMPETVSAIKK